MKFDDIDVKMLDIFTDYESLTCTDIAKLIFNPKDRNEMIAKNSFIDYRLKQWIKNKILSVEIKEKKKLYSFNKEVITFGDSFISVDNKKIDMGLALVIDLAQNGYLVKFITEEI